MSAPPDPVAFLEHVLPFQFLPLAQRQALGERLSLRRFSDGETIVRQGENSRAVFLLVEGRVSVFDDATGAEHNVIYAGHYFGERAALFDQPRRLTLQARGDTVVYVLPEKDFLDTVREFPVFAMALGSTLQVKQGIFLAFRRLYAKVLSLMDRGEFLLAELVDDYRRLRPALHPHLDERRIDTGALAYAIARLPQTVTQTTFYYLAGSLPSLYHEPDTLFPQVSTRARRRLAWEVFPSKLMVLLRDGISDITDFLTCLCCYAVEAFKLRARFRTSEELLRLHELAGGVTQAREAELLASLRLEPGEIAGLRQIWGPRTWVRLKELVLHHEDVAFEVDQQIDNYNSRAAEVWVSQIRAAASQLVDVEDPELRVHIVSSNTHSLSNCLSPYLARNKERILTWGQQFRPELIGEQCLQGQCGAWANDDDLLYVLAREFLATHPEEAERRHAEDAAAGHVNLEGTAYTGIEVDLFDVRALDPDAKDPALTIPRPEHPTLIVNVDYAFGQQAEEILSNLLYTFGQAVRSVNVLGKAGGLVGERGDVLLARATLLQTYDELYPLPNPGLTPDALTALTPGRDVHVGPVLTVAGTLLQDRPLLMFYKRIWKCIGLEMEGSFFARQLIAAVEAGVLRSDVRSRFVYYVSDVPLETGHTLTQSLHPSEGVPPLYAVTRAILREILAEA
ncbi:MAG: cyclic nucleotide-binding domain-containing protein [Planctomycetota bacterium]